MSRMKRESLSLLTILLPASHRGFPQHPKRTYGILDRYTERARLS